MQIRNIKKALGLLVADMLIIIGIFVLQFRTDSSIIEKIRNLHITLEKSDLENSELELKNKLQVSYNGLIFYIDEQNPAMLKFNSKVGAKPLKLVSWKKNENSFDFVFTDKVKFTVGLYSDEDNASFFANAELPASASALQIPYKYASNMKVQKSEGNHVILSAKKDLWEFSVPQFQDNYVSFNSGNAVAYKVYDETKKFSFDSITELAIANAQSFSQTKKAVKESLISAFAANTVESNISEQVAVSYVAARSEDGQFAKAIDDVPLSIRRSKTRTYLSAPYFDTLADMNGILETYIQSTEQQIIRAASTGSLDIFTIRNIASFLCITQNKEAVVQLLNSVVQADFTTANLAQVTGIIQAYAGLYMLKPEYAALLQPVIEKCIERIGDSCNFDGNNFTISEKDTFISVLQAVETGMAILGYGEISGNQTLVKAAYTIINSYLNNISSFDLRTLSSLYALLAYDNTYYPHFKIVNNDNDKLLWAWTCAKEIGYTKDEAGTITISIDFPAGLTHYVILKGLEKFNTIYIYNISFRTDPHFENYNSSGYVYKSDTKTLLLKSRQKEAVENVRFEYFVKPAPAPVVTEPAPAATPVETETVEEEAAAEEETAE